MLVLPQVGPPARPRTSDSIDVVRVQGGGPVPRKARQPPTIRIHARDGSGRRGQERGTRAPRSGRGPAHARRAFPGPPGERPGDRPRGDDIHIRGPAEERSRGLALWRGRLAQGLQQFQVPLEHTVRTGGLEDPKGHGEPRVVHEPAEWVESDLAFADVLVAVRAGPESLLRVVQMEGLDASETEDRVD